MKRQRRANDRRALNQARREFFKVQTASKRQACPTTDAVITDHVYRSSPNTFAARRAAQMPQPDRRTVPVGMCNWLGTCARPQDDHITVPDYRAQRGGP